MKDGVKVHIITSQPGGTEFLQKELIARDGPKIPDFVTLSSDPENKLLVKDAGDIWLIRTMDQFMDQVYEMAQPAVVVIDTASGSTIKECTWSWKTMGLAEENLTEMYEVEPGVLLVAYRPVISDLRSAIQERRPPKIGDGGWKLKEGLHKLDTSA